MRLRVDRQGDAVYLNLTYAAIVESEAVGEEIVVDFDAQSRTVGVKILDALQRIGTYRVCRA